MVRCFGEIKSSYLDKGNGIVTTRRLQILKCFLLMLLAVANLKEGVDSQETKPIDQVFILEENVYSVGNEKKLFSLVRTVRSVSGKAGPLSFDGANTAAIPIGDGTSFKHSTGDNVFVLNESVLSKPGNGRRLLISYANSFDMGLPKATWGGSMVRHPPSGVLYVGLVRAKSQRLSLVLYAVEENNKGDQRVLPPGLQGLKDVDLPSPSAIMSEHAVSGGRFICDIVKSTIAVVDDSILFCVNLSDCSDVFFRFNLKSKSWSEVSLSDVAVPRASSAKASP